MALSNFTSAPQFTFAKRTVVHLLHLRFFSAFNWLHNVRAHRIQRGGSWFAAVKANLTSYTWFTVKYGFRQSFYNVTHPAGYFRPCSCGCGGNVNRGGCWSC